MDHPRKYPCSCKLKYSSHQVEWLESISSSEGVDIQHALNGGEYTIPGTRYKVDGYCSTTNTIYEFHGDYWHGNPDVYPSDKLNLSRKLTMGQLHQRTLLREEYIKSKGYTLVSVWEHQYKINKKNGKLND